MLKTTSIKPGIPPVVSAYRGRKEFQILCMYKLKLISLNANTNKILLLRSAHYFIIISKRHHGQKPFHPKFILLAEFLVGWARPVPCFCDQS